MAGGTHWNEVTVFSPTTQAYIAEHIAKGDLVHVRGRLRQSSYERNGSRVYTVDLVASSFSRLAQGSDRAKASEPAREAAARLRGRERGGAAPPRFTASVAQRC